VPGVGARYRQHRRGSLSSADAVRFWRDVLVNAGEVERKWTSSGSLDEPRQAALAEAYSLCARLGFVKDRGLYEDSVRELARFPEFTRPRFLRAAHLLASVAGYAPARQLLAPFCRS
jgi:hypothetical protein